MKVFSNTKAIRYAHTQYRGFEIGVLIGQCLNELSVYEEPDLSEMVKIIVFEPGDCIQQLEGEMNFPFLQKCCDLAVEHQTCYELTYVISDSGYGLLLYVFKDEEVPASLLSYCKSQTQMTIYQRINLST